VQEPELTPADSREEAERRFARYEFADPFPDILPALLNAEDLVRYVHATGLIYPFLEDTDHLKSASYEVPIGGPCTFWDAQGNQYAYNVLPSGSFRLEPNTIGFVTLSPEFRLPSYLALSFNLRITHIYRGLLLGTGPIVDPGFAGRLSLPLHNLTSNPYEFSGTEGLIWLNVTKISSLPKGSNGQPDRPRYYFDTAKRWIDVYGYLDKANPGQPIRSSIPAALETNAQLAERSSAAALTSAAEARNAATTAATTATTANNQARFVQRLAIGGAVGLLISIALMLAATWAIVLQAETAVNAAQKSSDQVQQLNQVVCTLAAKDGVSSSTACPTPGQSPLGVSPTPSPSKTIASP
jgi:deoxycytidine triphosphate deaminase